MADCRYRAAFNKDKQHSSANRNRIACIKQIHNHDTMKKTALLFFCCMSHAILDCSAQRSESIELLFNIKSIIDPNQYELGLSMVEIQLVNTGKQSFQTSPLFWEIYDDAQLHWQRFWADNNQQEDLFFGAYGMQTASTHLNLSAFDISWYKNHTTPKQGDFMVRAGVLCCENAQAYYTEVLHIKVYPLNATDKAALLLLQKKGIAQQALHPNNLSQTKIGPALMDSLIQLHPKSTFTSLACLAQAHQYLQQADTKEKGLALLIRPMMSRFTYIRYLAEALAKVSL